MSFTQGRAGVVGSYPGAGGCSGLYKFSDCVGFPASHSSSLVTVRTSFCHARFPGFFLLFRVFPTNKIFRVQYFIIPHKNKPSLKAIPWRWLIIFKTKFSSIHFELQKWGNIQAKVNTQRTTFVDLRSISSTCRRCWLWRRHQRLSALLLRRDSFGTSGRGPENTSFLTTVVAH